MKINLTKDLLKITDSSNNILHLITDKNLFFHAHKTNINYLLISKTPTNADDTEGIGIDISKVTHYNDSAFNGDRNLLLNNIQGALSGLLDEEEKKWMPRLQTFANSSVNQISTTKTNFRNIEIYLISNGILNMTIDGTTPQHTTAFPRVQYYVPLRFSSANLQQFRFKASSAIQYVIKWEEK